MGRGDQRTRKGKILRGTYGVARPKKKKKTIAANEEKSIAAKGKKTKSETE